MVNNMTGFSTATFLRDLCNDSKSIGMSSFAVFFIPYGLPWLLMVDDDPTFKDAFLQLYCALQVPILPVSPENCKAIQNECFHSYLYKLHHIDSTNTGTLEQAFCLQYTVGMPAQLTELKSQGHFQLLHATSHSWNDNSLILCCSSALFTEYSRAAKPWGPETGCSSQVSWIERWNTSQSPFHLACSTESTHGVGLDDRWVLHDASLATQQRLGHQIIYHLW